MTILWGISDFLFRNGTIFYKSPAIDWIASGNLIWRIPNSGIFSLTIFFIAVFVALRTPFGRYMYSIGSGEKVSKFSGIQVNRWKLMAFLASGIFCGMAGVLLLARTRNGTARMGEGILTDAIAAIVMGGTPLTGGAGGIHRSIIGVLIITVLSNGMNVTGVQLYLQIVIKGIVMMLAVAMTLDRSRIEFVK
jgi:ribose/xylose/arabinose/galactoside ABC-type transport system permease subunit